MKFKKILSSFIAVAMAVTTFSAFPITADASIRTITVFKGEHNLEEDMWFHITAEEAFCFKSDTVKIGITYEVIDTDPNNAPKAIFSRKDGTYSLGSTYSGIDGDATERFTVNATSYEKACEDKDIMVQGDNLIIREITITGEYNNPNEAAAADVGEQYITVNGATEMGSICFNTQSRSERKEIKPGTHTYELNYTMKGYRDELQDYNADDTDIQILLADTTGAQYYSDISVDLLVDGVEKISDITVKNGTDYCKYDADAWDYSIDEAAPGFMYEIRVADSDAVGYIPAGSTVTFRVTVTYTPLEPYVAYQQYTEYTSYGVKASGIRGVMLITEEDAKDATSVDFTFSNGTKEVTLNSTKCYSEIKVAGNKIVAPDGYVFVAYAMSGIPEGTTVTCTNITVNK